MKSQKRIHSEPFDKDTMEYYRDIEMSALESKHLELERALKDSRERFRAIADFTYDWENWHSPDGRLLWVNRSVERMTGYTIEECMKMDNFPLPIIFSEDSERIEKFYKESLINPTVETDVIFRIRRKNGALLWVSASWQPIYGNDGNCNGLRSSIRDISKRIQAENILKKVIEEMRKSNEVINIQVYEMNEMKFKLEATERKYEELVNRRDRFLSMISQDLVKIFIQLQNITDLIKDCPTINEESDIFKNISKLKRFIQDSIKEANSFFLNS